MSGHRLNRHRLNLNRPCWRAMQKHRFFPCLRRACMSPSPQTWDPPWTFRVRTFMIPLYLPCSGRTREEVTCSCGRVVGFGHHQSEPNCTFGLSRRPESETENEIPSFTAFVVVVDRETFPCACRPFIIPNRFSGPGSDPENTVVCRVPNIARVVAPRLSQS